MLASLHAIGSQTETRDTAPQRDFMRYKPREIERVELGSTRLQICGCANITAGLRRYCWRGMAITHSKDSALLTHWFLRPSVGERLPVHKADRVMGSKPSIYCVPMMPTPPAWAYAWMGSRQTAN